MQIGIKKEKNRGLGLVDLLVGIALSLTLTLGLLKLFDITRQSLILSNAVSGMVENANVAVIAFKNVAVLAGHKAPSLALYMGCYRTNRPSSGNTADWNFAGDLGWGVGSTNKTTACVNSIYNYYSSGAPLFTSFGMMWGGYCTFSAVDSPFRFGFLPDTSCSQDNTSNVYQLVGADYARLGNFGPTATFGAATGANLSIVYQGQIVYTPSGVTKVLQDCVGNTLDRNQVVQNNFKLDTTTNILSCSSNTQTVSAGDATGTPTFYTYQYNSGVTTSPTRNIISNVQVMEVLFASGLNPSTWGSVDGTQKGYVKPSDFSAATNNATPTWSFMQSYNLGVQIALLLQSDDKVSTVKDTKIYGLLTAVYGPYNDNRIRRVVTLTLKTNECIPEHLPTCGGSSFIAYLDQGPNGVNKTGGRIHLGETVILRTEQNSTVCPTYPYVTAYGCTMDTRGYLAAQLTCNGTTVNAWTSGVGVGYYPFNVPTSRVIYNGVTRVTCGLGVN